MGCFIHNGVPLVLRQIRSDHKKTITG